MFLTLPSLQLAFALTVRLSTRLLQVCPYVRRATSICIDVLLWRTNVHPKSDFSTGPSPRIGYFKFFLHPRNTIAYP